LPCRGNRSLITGSGGEEALLYAPAKLTARAPKAERTRILNAQAKKARETRYRNATAERSR
jgi:hypothetical protein